ncbi:MAG TPA: putative quinol monooxygenase [Planctomycetota bacterium]|nr:putative quinol monooxygenase [Planctomycetota bacterium]
MYVVIVQLNVKPDRIDEFLQHTLHNATNARSEPGCLRFDVHRHETEPARFAFYEVYRTPDDFKAHQETAHYKAWKEKVPDLLAEPRVGTRYHSVSPKDGEWK